MRNLLKFFYCYRIDSAVSDFERKYQVNGIATSFLITEHYPVKGIHRIRTRQIKAKSLQGGSDLFAAGF